MWGGGLAASHQKRPTASLASQMSNYQAELMCDTVADVSFSSADPPLTPLLTNVCAERKLVQKKRHGVVFKWLLAELETVSAALMSPAEL